MLILKNEQEWTLGPSVVALGMFDGVHLGHTRLIQETVELARRKGLTSAVVTFSAHPLLVLKPGNCPPMLTTIREKTERLQALDPDVLVMREFDAAFASLSAEEYVARLARTLRPQVIVVGFNYSFGARGAGNSELLERLEKEHGFQVRILEPVRWKGEPISSSRVRAALTAGDMESVRAMLGGSYRISGKVVHGKRVGRSMGFPTANLALPDGKALPPFGVYAARVGEIALPAVVNIGMHPTVPGGGPTVEVHLPGVTLDLYDQHIEAALVAWLRPEREFANLDALRAQIALDVGAARRALESDELPCSGEDGA